MTTSNGQLVALVDINAAPTAVFGSIDPGTGVFTQIGGATNLTGNEGHVPVYDPAANAFVPTAAPPRNFSNTLERIDAATGATTEIVLQNILGSPPLILGLGVADLTQAVSEPLSAALLPAFILAMALVSSFRHGRLSACGQLSQTTWQSEMEGGEKVASVDGLQTVAVNDMILGVEAVKSNDDHS